MELLKSQRAEIAKVLAESGLSPREFIWEDIKDAQSLVHAKTKYYFTFDRFKDDDQGSLIWECVFSPGPEELEGYDYASSWYGVSSIFTEWVKRLKAEVEAEDPWAEVEEEFAGEWTTSNEKFTVTEIKKLDARLDEIKAYLLEHADDNEKTKKSIETGIEELKSSARAIGKKDWAMMFAGWFFTQCADWAVSQVHWQHVVTLLLKSTKTFLLQS